MLGLVQLLILIIMMIKSDGSSDIITVSKSSGDTVLLRSDLQVDERWDVRWTHRHLLLNKNKTTCHHGRCELLRDGTLRFNRVQPQDAGIYKVEVFDEGGKLQTEGHFLLQVEESSSIGGGAEGGSVVTCVIVLLFLLLILSIIFVLRRRRRSQRMPTGQTEDNVYMMMHGRHGNTGKQVEQDKKEEDSTYEPFHPAAVTEQAEDIYV